MFPIFVYLYNNFHHPNAVPDSLILAQRLSELGFDEQEIVLALDCLLELSDPSKTNSISVLTASPHAFRCYTNQEQDLLGSSLIAQIEEFVRFGAISFEQRELLIEQAFSLGETPLSQENFKALLLLSLWSQEREGSAFEILGIEASILRKLH